MFDFDAGTWVEGRTRDQSGSPCSAGAGGAEPDCPGSQNYGGNEEAALYVAEHVFRACSVIDRRMSGLDPGNWTRGL